MKYFYKVLLGCLLIFAASCSEKKEEISVPKVEPIIEIAEPVVEEELVEEIKPLVFTVQVGAFQNSNVTIESSNPDLNIVIEDGLTKFRLGQFSTYKDANNLKATILSSYSDAFIVATNNDVRIYIGDALALSNEN